MRIDQLNVALRQRTSWEAMELGTALVRRHAAAIFKPWLLLTVPVLVLCNLLGWWLDSFALAGVLMWWLKPVFERIPLYVISRSVFGEEPATAQTLRAQWRWGWRELPGYLLWRRLGLARALLLPVDLLEGGDAAQRRQRRHAMGSASYLQTTTLTTLCLNFEAALQLAGVALIFMFVPFELLPESLRAAWAMIGNDTPAWVWIGWNVLGWAAMSVIAPFYIGAGFGLYLNRRTELEAWDIEISFRRMRDRLRRGALSLAAALALLMPLTLLPPPSAWAQQADANPHAAPLETQEKDDTAADTDTGEDADQSGASIGPSHKAEAPAHPATPAQLFVPYDADLGGFRQAAMRTYEDPQLGSTRTVERWQKIQQDPDNPVDMSWAKGLGKLLALLAEWTLWIVVGLAVLGLLLTARWWWPWLRDATARRAPPPDSPLAHTPLLVPEALPPDIATQARRLWQAGKARHALALLYRASVDSMAQRANLHLPPGATEAQCLRAARQLPHEDDRRLFADMVRVWQYAAYAGRLPDDATFDHLVQSLQARFGWAA